MSDHTITFQQTPAGYRIRLDAPGVAAVSAPVPDPMTFIVIAANQLGLEADDSVDGQVTISVPPGA
jgi:hypothetical protein